MTWSDPDLLSTIKTAYELVKQQDAALKVAAGRVTTQTREHGDWIDVVIPPTGWEREPAPYADDPWESHSLVGAISPGPTWLYDTYTLAKYHCTDAIRLHPDEIARLHRASWAAGTVQRPGLQIGAPIFGIPIVVDPDVPEGIVRIRRRSPATPWPRTRDWENA